MPLGHRWEWGPNLWPCHTTFPYRCLGKLSRREWSAAFFVVFDKSVQTNSWVTPFPRFRRARNKMKRRKGKSREVTECFDGKQESQTVARSHLVHLAHVMWLVVAQKTFWPYHPLPCIHRNSWKMGSSTELSPESWSESQILHSRGVSMKEDSKGLLKA